MIVQSFDWDSLKQLKSVTKTDLKKIDAVREAWSNNKIELPDKISKAAVLRAHKKLIEIQREEKLKELVENTPDNYYLIQTKNQFYNMLTYLEKEEMIAVDTETTGLDIFGDDYMVGFSLTLPKADKHYYVPLHHLEGEQLDEKFVIDRIKPYLEDESIGKILHNAKFDAHVFNKCGVRLRGIIGDTIVMMHCLNENEGPKAYGLKTLCEKYLKIKGDSFNILFKEGELNKAPLDVGLAYAAKDTDLTYKLYQFQMKYLNTEKLKGVKYIYENIENGIIDVTIDIENEGIKLDEEFAKSYLNDLETELEEIKTRLFEHFPEDTNFNSSVQLKKIFYEDWGLEDISGKQSTNKDTVEYLIAKTKHEGLKALLDYRTCNKLITTYIGPLPNLIKNDGRIHGQFRQTGTDTGRFSSKQPNLQNIPPAARPMFIAPEGYILVGIDFSQIEPRITAHISQDEEMINRYRDDKDLYALMASKIFNKTVEECEGGSKYRKMTKVILLGILYGKGEYKLGIDLEISTQEAKKIINDLFNSYPKVKKFIDDTHQFLKENEYVETLYGRKRRFPGHKEKAIIFDKIKNTKYKYNPQYKPIMREVSTHRRKGVNAIIQGTAADIMKMAMIEAHKICIEKGYKMVFTIHDEILFYVPEDINIEEIEELEQAMVSCVDLTVPMKCDTMITRRWGEDEKSKEEWFNA
jgi:DNA polymerase-1